MDISKIKVVALDLDGTLTQHKQPLDKEHKEALDALSEHYKLLMAGAGQVGRIFEQMNRYPVDIIGNYGMQYGTYNPGKKSIDMIRDIKLPANKPLIEEKITFLRNKYGYTSFKGDNVEFHPSGCITFPI